VQIEMLLVAVDRRALQLVRFARGDP
jgi:hypothetical protein